MIGQNLYVKNSFKMLYLVTGIILTALGVITLLMKTTTGSPGLGVGILMLFMWFWTKSQPLVRVANDHINVKLAPLAPRHLILFREIRNVVVKDPKKIVVQTEVNGQRRDIKLGLGLLETADAQRLVAFLRQYAKQGVA